MHSWAVTCFGVKVDACPGRLNRLSLSTARPGYFLGQCSELCGGKSRAYDYTNVSLWLCNSLGVIPKALFKIANVYTNKTPLAGNDLG